MNFPGYAALPLAVALLVGAAPQSAWAQAAERAGDTTASTAPAPEGVTPPPGGTAARPRWGHRNQVSVRLGFAEGYSFVVRYASGDPCGPMGSEIFCHTRSPFLLDTAAGFGITDTIELEARFRFGEPAFTGTIPLALGAGIRLYGDENARFKFVGGGAVFADFTDRGTAASYGPDFQVRFEEGVQYEIERHVGVFFQFGETFGIVRALSCVVDLGMGVQARFP